MPDLSPFQTLPLHIAESIGYYCIGLLRHRHKDRYAGWEKAQNVWLVLHDVSYSWMLLARGNLNKRVTLLLSTNTENGVSFATLYSRRAKEQSTAITQDVKEVHIDFYDKVEKPNKEDLDRVWPEDLVFPKARTLNCHLRLEYTRASNSARYDNGFKQLVERVRSSFPNLQEFKISFRKDETMSIGAGVFMSKEWDASLFLSAFFRAIRYNYRESGDSAFTSNEDKLFRNAPELTSLHYYEGLGREFVSWIIKKSARTLEKLRYGEKGGGGGFQDFMFGDNGQVIVYPRLRELHVLDYNNNKGELTTDKSIVPFPALQRLGMHCSCVFKDDTLFRGFGKTLMSLDIVINRGFVDIFRKHKVFSQGTYPNLFHIAATPDNRPGLTISADEFTEAAFGLVSPATQSIIIDGETSYQCINSVISTCPYLENVQILHLTKTRLILLEILDIFKHFPRVTDFGCYFEGVDSELNDIQDQLIPSHLGKQYFQLSSRLKCLHMYSSEGASCRDTAVLFVTLAVLCPNFTFVRWLKWSSATYENTIEYIISSGSYDQHAKRLGQLFEV